MRQKYLSNIQRHIVGGIFSQAVNKQKHYFMKTLYFCLTLFFLSSTLVINGQTMVTTTPNASQKAFVGQAIGLTDVKVVYHRPAVKDREIWGKMVPMNAIWRAGANENTVIKFSKNVKIEGQDLSAGVYGLHMIPQENEWVIIFSNNSTSWGSYSYNESEDALRVSVKPQKADAFHEFLTYTFDEITASTAQCALQWADKKIGFAIEADVHQAVLASLRNELRDKAGWSWNGWNEAANYCLANDINHQEALSWASRSVFMSPNGTNMMTKAKLVAATKGDKEKEEEVILASLQKDLESMNVTWKEWHAAANYATKVEKWEKAISWVDESIEMSRNMTNLMSRAKIYETKGEKDKAEKLRKEAIDKGTNAELNMYAYNLMWTGKTADAVKIFEANSEKNPSDPNVWDSLGEGYFNNGEKEKAIKAFKKSLSMNPPDAVAANSRRHLMQLGVKMDESKIKP